MDKRTENQPKDLADVDYASPTERVERVQEPWRLRVFYGFCAANILTGILSPIIVAINRTRPDSAEFVAGGVLAFSVVIFVASWIYLVAQLFILRKIRLGSIPAILVFWLILSTLEFCLIGGMTVGLVMFLM